MRKRGMFMPDGEQEEAPEPQTGVRVEIGEEDLQTEDVARNRGAWNSQFVEAAKKKKSDETKESLKTEFVDHI